MEDMEKSIKVLRRIKNAYKQTHEVKCKGCMQVFKPVIFKAHLQNCPKLLENEFAEIAAVSDSDQIFIKATFSDENL